VCGSQALEPNLWATATLTASSDSLSQTAVIGGACSQSPQCGEAAARIIIIIIIIIITAGAQQQMQGVPRCQQLIKGAEHRLVDILMHMSISYTENLLDWRHDTYTRSLSRSSMS